MYTIFKKYPGRYLSVIAGYYYSVWEFPLVRVPDDKTIAMAVPRAEYRSTNQRFEFFTGDGSRDGH